MKNDQTKEPNQYQNYNVLVREEAKVFVLSIPELGLLTRNVSIDEGYRELQLAKANYIKNIIEAGLGSTIPDPTGPTGLNFKPSALKKFYSAMLTFTSKAIIILLLLFGMSSIGLTMAGNIATKGMARLSNKIERYQPLEKAVSKIEEYPEEKIDDFRRQLRRVSKKLQPLVRELKIIWKSERLDISDDDSFVARKELE
ncbi:MAG: hypothetical protein HOF21_11620 [Nitrospina sp.]|nr:hypothetical protein [Nitrospina sp.]MBT5633276.1 hypothetical protein [Nitrospina sp.]